MNLQCLPPRTGAEIPLDPGKQSRTSELLAPALAQTIPAISSVSLATPHALELRISTSEDPTGYWRREINACCDHGKAHTLELCRLVSSARRALKHGEWSELWRKKAARFSKSKADKLARVGTWLKELNAHTCEHLPAGWRILRVLSRIDRRTIPSLVAVGQIHPEITLAEAEALVARILPGEIRRARKSNITKYIARFCSRVRETFPNWTEREQFDGARSIAELAQFMRTTRSLSSSVMETHAVASAAASQQPEIMAADAAFQPLTPSTEICE